MEQGFYLDRGQRRLLARSVRVEPILGWDSNINGGLPNRRLELPGLTLVTTPRYAAKAGLVLGARAVGQARFGWRPGAYLEAGVELESVWSPKHRTPRSYGGVSLCARTHLGGWRFADLCQTASLLDRELGRSRSAATSLGVSRLFAAAGGSHELALTATRRVLDGRVQPAATLALASAWSGAAMRISATVAAPVSDRLAQRRRLSAEYRRTILGKRVLLEIASERATGGRFLGVAREDHTGSITLGLPLGRALLQVSLAETKSNLAFFDERRVDLGLRLDVPFAVHFSGPR